MIALDFSTFLGRFHPLFVHMPIGFVFLAILLEWWQSFKKLEKISSLISIAWFLSGLSAIMAALCGWYLGETGLYEEEQLFLHRWLGIVLVPIFFAGWWLKKNYYNYSKIIQHGFNLLIIVLLSIEGHQGGNLTHGDTYLTEFAPEPLQNLMGAKNEVAQEKQLINPDSVKVYEDLIYPIFENSCINCHCDEVKRGGLNMAYADSLMLGGSNNNMIIEGNAEGSELFRRITLPQKSIKFMPPTKKVLTYDQIKTIEWWINQGASFEATLTDVEVSKNMKPVLLRQYGLNTEPKPWYEKVKVSPLDSTKISAIQKQGFKVKVLGEKIPLLDISYTGKDLTLEKMKTLEMASSHITWLVLSGTNVKDEYLSGLIKFSNLTRLELDNTQISDNGVFHLKNASHLEILNLYNTLVSKVSLPVIKELPGLKRVYLSETKVLPEDVKSFNEDDSKLSVIITSKD